MSRPAAEPKPATRSSVPKRRDRKFGFAAVSTDWELSELNGSRLITSEMQRQQPVAPIFAVSCLAELRPTAREIVANLFDRNAALVAKSRLTGGRPAVEVEAAGSKDAAWSLDSAVAAAAVLLGYPVTESGRGATVEAVRKGRSDLRENDVITAVDATLVFTAAAMSAALSSRQAVTVTVTRQDPAGERVITVPLSRNLDGLWGVRVITADRSLQHPINARFELPADLLGPSVGLAAALSVLDAYTGANLAQGGAIAATGTVDLTGQVGEVGAVEFKARAVLAHGQIRRFFMPASPAADVAVARRVLHRGPEVVAVSTLAQAVGVLRTDN